AVAIARWRRREPPAPHGLEAGSRLGTCRTECRGDGLLADALGTKHVRELHRAIAGSPGADRLLGKACIRQPPALREVVEENFEVVAFANLRLELALELGARMLPPRKKTHGPGAQGSLFP